MANYHGVHTKQTILDAFGNANNEIEDFFSTMPLDSFVGQSSTEWHGAQILEHLVKLIEAIATGLALPKEFIRKKGGYPEKVSGSFEDIRGRYLQALADGAQSPEAYYPPDRSIAMDGTAYKQQLLATWRSANDQLRRNIESWTEVELDQYLLLHPLLGKMTVREVLFCALCHNQGHLDSERNRMA